MPASIKTLKPEEFSEDRRKALKEVEEDKKRKQVGLKIEQPIQHPTIRHHISRRSDTLDIIRQTLGNNKMRRDELLQKSGLTQGQLAGTVYKSQKTNGILKFENGYFFIG